jgi:outer membrane protein assembly factor BamB
MSMRKPIPRRWAAMGLLAVVFLWISPAALAAQTGGGNAEAGTTEFQVGAAPVWEQNLEDLVLGQPFLQAESVVVAGNGGSVQSYSMGGTSLWKFDPRGSATPYVTRSPEGATYICNAAGSLMAVNRVGRELWRWDLGKPISGPVIVGWDGRIFIPAGAEIYCRTASGFALWRQDLGSAIAMPPVLDHGGGIVTFLENRDFLRIDPFGVMERIRLDRVPAITVPLKSGNRDCYFIIYPSGETELITLNTEAAAGSKLSRSRRAALPGTPVAAAGMADQAAVTLRDGRVIFLSGAGEQISWRGNSHETAEEKGSGNLNIPQAAMVFDERGVFVLSIRGATAFTAEGRRRWLLHIPEMTAVPALSDEGLLYTCGNDRVLHTYKPDNRVRNVPRSMYGPDPEGTYGMGNPPPSPWVADGDRFDPGIITAMQNRIDSAVRNGQVGDLEPSYVGYLMEMTGGLLNTPGYSPVRPPVHVPQRIELIRLLARMGSRETIPFLTNLFYRDPEPSIKAACCEAIARIGVDPKGDAVRAFSVLLSPDNANRDPMTLMAATSSIAALCRFSGPPLAYAGIRLLYAFSHSDFPPVIKRQAQQELDALRREGLDRVVP